MFASEFISIAYYTVELFLCTEYFLSVLVYYMSERENFYPWREQSAFSTAFCVSVMSVFDLSRVCISSESTYCPRKGPTLRINLDYSESSYSAIVKVLI